MDARGFIEDLRRDNESFYGDERGRGALKDLQTVFPVSWIYLAELVQNAIDVGATRLRFAPQDDGDLVFEHNGKPFTAENVRALCLRGVSTKSTNTVGFMGVGFKSVFKVYETVVVSSGEWRFQLSVPSDDTFGVRQWIGAVLPRWAPQAEDLSDWYTCRFSFTCRLADGTPESDLAELLRDGQALLPLLAWNKVTDFEAGRDRWYLSFTETSIEAGDASKVRVDASSRDGRGRAWMLFIRSYQPSESAVIRLLQHRQIQAAPQEREKVLTDAKRLRDVTLFCELSQDGSPQPVKRGQCFSLVPTGHTTCLGLHMQADWLLDISRREPMKIANDPWQEEILAQVPHLLRSYLAWLVSDETDSAGWSDGYNALPGSAEGYEIDQALRGTAIEESVRAVLSDLDFVPFETADDKIEFVNPALARFLPPALQRAVSGGAVPAELFGRTIVAADTLGGRANAFLRDTGLLEVLSPSELEEHWSGGYLATWYNSDDEDRKAGYVGLIGSLAELDSDDDWASARLRCLPAADGEWRSKQELRRYPPNWSILAPSPRSAEALEPFAGAPAELLDWKIDQSLRRDLAAQRYLSSLQEPKLEEVVGRWWAALPEEVEEKTQRLVVEFTDLIRRQRTLPRLVTKVLAVGDDGARLLPIDQAVLTDPYAGSYRRVLFPGQPTVSPAYRSSSIETSDAEWRVFFEEQRPAPLGRPALVFSRRVATPAELRSLDFLPPRRATYAESTFAGMLIDSFAYYVIDTNWPVGVDPTAAGLSATRSTSLQRFMLEMSNLLTWRLQHLAYIAPRSNSVSTIPLTEDSTWFRSLRDTAWIFDQAGDGPYRARQLLAAADPSRHDAPVAHLVDGFAELAGQIGLRFGEAIPNAPAVARLRTGGPAASWSELDDLLREAIAEADANPEALDLLHSVVSTTPLFMLPDGRTSPDGLRRVPGSRVVVQTTRRSTLGDWVCSVDSFDDDGIEQAVLTQVDSVIDLPKTTTEQHAAAFLRWVWNDTPDADAVRQILPRAFQYALELPDADKERLRAEAKVFVTARRWVSVSDGCVFLNDLDVADKELLSADRGVSLATPGHLGEDDETRHEVCDLLGLPLASSHYTLRIDDQGGTVVTPEAWRAGFRRAQQSFADLLSAADDDDVNSHQLDELELTCVESVTKRLLKNGIALSARSSNVAIRHGRVHVVGPPQDFAPALAESLIEHWGLTLRHDSHSLAARLTGLLGRLDVASEENERDTPTPVAPHTAPDVSPREPTESSEQLDGPDASGTERERANGGGTASHTAKRKDSLHNSQLNRLQELQRQIKQLQQQIAEGLGADVIPEETAEDDAPRKAFGDDARFRDAVVDYEVRHGRFPQVAEAKQAGYDIDSYSHDVDHPDRALARRIEVKGKGTVWIGDEIVQLSDRQLKDALAQRVAPSERAAPGFDYWLYVVETGANGLRILPVRNPARRAATFEFRGSVWRTQVEGDSFEESP